MASITHIVKYLQPGIDLITLDPKLSSTIIGRERSAATMDARSGQARRARYRVYNQQACLNARSLHPDGPTRPDRGREPIRKLVYERSSDPCASQQPCARSNRLAEEIEDCDSRSAYKPSAATPRCIIVSRAISRRIRSLLANRVANLVRSTISTSPSPRHCYTQRSASTRRIIPKSAISCLAGAQRLITLGYVAPTRSFAAPTDGAMRHVQVILSEWTIRLGLFGRPDATSRSVTGHEESDSGERGQLR